MFLINIKIKKYLILILLNYEKYYQHILLNILSSILIVYDTRLINARY